MTPLSLLLLIFFCFCLLVKPFVDCLQAINPDEMHLTLIGDQAFLSPGPATHSAPAIARDPDIKIPGIRKSSALRKPAKSPSDLPRIWSSGIVPYFFHSFESKRAIKKIRSCMAEISANTCIKFVPVTKLIQEIDGKEHVPPHVQIFQGQDNECWSVYGTHDVHPISLSRGCWDRGTILHELMHVIGFEHSHTRPDRDRYLRVHWDNIEPNDWDEFIIRNKSIEARLVKKLPFDYASIMMYGELNGSRDEESPVLSRRDGKKLIDLEDKRKLSPVDIRLVNKVYRCHRRRRRLRL